MQKAYINALYDIMRKDRRVCSLLSDSGTDYDTLMARDIPGQCFNFGIAEQNKVAAASGMAAMGKIPFVYTTGAFIAYRAYEFVRDDICFQRRNVKLMGMGMGMGMGAWSTLGVSHHTTEDIAALRALPNLTLLCASTPLQLKWTVHAAYETEGPVYIRMGMSAEDELYPPEHPYSIGKNNTLIHGNDYVVFGAGTVMGEIHKAVKRLNEEGAGVQLVDVHTVKPLDTEGILTAIRGKKQAFSVEEHNILGGLGGAIAEVLADANANIALKRIGLYDAFASGYGRTNQVRAANGLDAEGIYNQIKKHLYRRACEYSINASR
jgi:transketolase